MSDLERGQVMISDSSHRMQTLQVEVWGSDDPRDDCEHWEPYGFTSRPMDPDSEGGADALVASRGSADDTVVLCVGDRRYRLRNLAKGDVAVFDHRGQFVKLTADGIDAQPATGKHVRILGTDVQLGDGADAAVTRWAEQKTILDDLIDLIISGGLVAGSNPVTPSPASLAAGTWAALRALITTDTPAATTTKVK